MQQLVAKMDVVLIQLLGALAVGLMVSVVIDQMLAPRPIHFFKRDFRSQAIHIGTWLLLFCFELLLFRRPWFAMGNVFAIQIFMVLVNNAKFSSLKEAFICQDFEYFADLIKHPMLYIPFFGILRTVLATICFIGVLVAGLALESSPLNSSNWVYLGVIWLLILAVSIVLLRGALRGDFELSLNPNSDLSTMGQAAFLWRYGIQALRQTALPGGSPFNNPEKNGLDGCLPKEQLPTLIAVQSESFFDPRREYSFVTPELLAEFDKAVQQSPFSGRLTVPAWGANTVRSECGFLTSMSAVDFGIHQFNPYRFLRHKPSLTMASFLKSLGYKTICIHPYPKTFYLRDQVYPKIGFDDFIDDSFFDDKDRVGPYVGDKALASYVDKLLEEYSDEPVFLFIITMENHGPLHLEDVGEYEQAQYFKEPQGDDARDLVAYCRHLDNADDMIEKLKQTLSRQPNGGGLCWYGDHVPIMADVYKQFGEPDGKTDYFIWSSSNANEGHLSSTEIQNMNINELALKFLQHTLSKEASY